MKRYFQCHKKQKKKIHSEFVEGTPVEILSPLFKHCQPLPKEKEKLQVLDFELMEQVHLLQAEYNKRFQDAKSSIEKNDLVRGIHYLTRSNDVKKRILDLEKKHQEILTALEEILKQESLLRKTSRTNFQIPPTPK